MCIHDVCMCVEKYTIYKVYSIRLRLRKYNIYIVYIIKKIR